MYIQPKSTQHIHTLEQKKKKLEVANSLKIRYLQIFRWEFNKDEIQGPEHANN